MKSYREAGARDPEKYADREKAGKARREFPSGEQRNQSQPEADQARYSSADSFREPAKYRRKNEPPNRGIAVSNPFCVAVNLSASPINGPSGPSSTQTMKLTSKYRKDAARVGPWPALRNSRSIPRLGRVFPLRFFFIGKLQHHDPVFDANRIGLYAHANFRLQHGSGV